MKEIKIKDYVGTCKICDEFYFTPSITGYDCDDNEYYMELDLYESAKYNWDKYKERYPNASNYREFRSEFQDVCYRAEKMRRRAR